MNEIRENWEFKNLALPTVPVPGPDGKDHLVTYAGHHVIATKVFEQSEFMKALQAHHLWDQGDFKTNGVALVQTIDGETATKTAGREIVGGAAHTGGHTAYNDAQIRVLRMVFKTRRRPGAHGGVFQRQ